MHEQGKGFRALFRVQRVRLSEYRTKVPAHRTRRAIGCPAFRVPAAFRLQAAVARVTGL